ncbi:peptide deformylase [Ancylobacter dichloromethanicus]
MSQEQIAAEPTKGGERADEIMSIPGDPILPIDHPLLSRPSEPVGVIDEAIRSLAHQMFTIMDHAQGAGLAAVQIGVPLRLVVIDMPDGTGQRHRLAMVNPSIISVSDEMIVGEEGCLSMPGYAIPVPRHIEIEVRYLDLGSEYHLLRATGRLAVCVQHEVDHTDGILFYDRVSRLRRQRARDHFRKVRRQYEGHSGYGQHSKADARIARLCNGKDQTIIFDSLQYCTDGETSAYLFFSVG